MIEKNFKKDFQNLLEVLESSKLVEDLKLKSGKSKIEFKMLFAPPELHWNKVLLLVVDVHYSMLLELLTT